MFSFHSIKMSFFLWNLLLREITEASGDDGEGPSEKIVCALEEELIRLDILCQKKLDLEY